MTVLSGSITPQMGGSIRVPIDNYGDIATNDSFVLKARSLDGVITLLQNLKELLDNAYVDCEPLRRLIRKVDTSIKLTSKYS